MRAPTVGTVDFETKRIQDRPRYPPEPVGVSIQMPGERKTRYYAWGHPTDNNCTLAEGKRAVQAAWKSGHPLLFQNGKFDVDVAETWMGVKPLPWDMLHDTMFLLFFDDPHAPNHSLKPSAKRILGMEPEERDAVAEWLVEHQGELRADGLLPMDERITMKNFGAWISLAPGGLVGKYADGDVVRTLKLFKKLYPEVCGTRGMLEAYDRERRLMPKLLDNERQGVRADLKRLEADCRAYERAQATVDQWLLKKLRRDINLDSDDELLDALVSAKLVDEGKLLWTSGGKKGVPKPSASKDSLEAAVKDPRVLSTLQYRSKLGTFYGTFLKPWRDEARETGGIVHPAWNQVKQREWSGDAGARTGRMSASRFMNAPKEVAEKDPDQKGYHHPSHIKDLPPLPFVRNYLLPDPGDLWGKRDYSQQEFRILAHYEDGELLRRFKENPKMDVHVLVASILFDKDTAKVTPDERDIAKTIGFGLLYGLGAAKMAAKLRRSEGEARELKSQYMRALPGIKDLQSGIKDLVRANEPICTWGGREYFCEPPKQERGYMRTFEYKLLNYLIQGSAADCTKQAIINYDEHPKRKARFLLTVHDELNISVNPKLLKQEMKVLEESMLDVAFSVPMLSDGKSGKCWGQLTKL